MPNAGLNPCANPLATSPSLAPAPSCPQCIPIAVVPGNGIRHYLVQLTGNQYHVKDGTRCKNARFNLLAMRSSGCFAISSQTAVADL